MDDRPTPPIPVRALANEQRYLIGTRSSIVSRAAPARIQIGTTSYAHWQVGDIIPYQNNSRQFKVEAVLVGGMGVVYVVTDMRNGDPFVVKAIRDQFAYHPALVARFKREAEAWMALQKHPKAEPCLKFVQRR
ncbi:hypothetical protein ACFLYO_05635 [Chloroflexota bacterium]